MILTLVAFSILLYPITPVLLVYVILVYVGSWVYPLFTVYIPHNAHEKYPIFQTKAFRGKIISTIFAHHNYHCRLWARVWSPGVVFFPHRFACLLTRRRRRARGPPGTTLAGRLVFALIKLMTLHGACIRETLQ